MKTVFKSLFGLLALVLLTNVASAQYVGNDLSKIGDGDNPFIGTEYTYTVTLGTVGNAIEWFVYDTDGEYAVLTPTVSASGNYDMTVGAVSTTVSAKITWKNAGTYYLTYKETAANGCVTYRGITVIPQVNNLIIAASSATPTTCNSKENSVLDWTNYNQPEDLVKTDLEFVVDLTKDATFNINSWQFTGTFDLPTGVTIVADSDVSIAGAGASIAATGSGFKTIAVTGCTGTSVTITVAASSLVTTTGAVELTLASKKALSGSGTIVTTDSNGGNDVQTNTLNGLPAATNISFN